MNLYAAAVQSLKPSQIDHNRSDLYILMTNDSLSLINEYRSHGGKVRHVVERGSGLYWYHIPWGYTPYWQRHFRFITENFAWEFIDRNEHTPFLRDWTDENLRKTFETMKTPPNSNLYPAIRSAICSILSPHGIHSRQISLPA